MAGVKIKMYMPVLEINLRKLEENARSTESSGWQAAVLT